jgi:hypothetical protein
MPRYASLAILSALVLGLASSAPSPARAGIGNPIKKAKDAVTKEAKKGTKTEAQAKPCDQPVFDDVTVELTEARLSRMVETFHKMESILAPRMGLVEKRNKLMEDRGAIWDKNGEKIQNLEQKRDDVKGCYHEGYQRASEKELQEYSQRAMSDPKLLEKYKNLAMQNNAAAAAGDTAAQNRINAGMMEEMLPSSGDSAQVRKECGPVPPTTKEEDQINALDKQIQALEGEIRKIDDKSSETQAKGLGLTPVQMGTAFERIRGFRGSSKDAAEAQGGRKKKGDSGSSSDAKSDSKSDSGSDNSGSAAVPSQCGYTDVEAEALSKHATELVKYLN